MQGIKNMLLGIAIIGIILVIKGYIVKEKESKTSQLSKFQLTRSAIV